MMKPDMAQAEVAAPFTGRCSSGHDATGMMFQNKPVRWFRVTSTNNPHIDGVYCEPCLILANAKAREIRQKK